MAGPNINLSLDEIIKMRKDKEFEEKAKMFRKRPFGRGERFPPRGGAHFAKGPARPRRKVPHNSADLYLEQRSG